MIPAEISEARDHLSVIVTVGEGDEAVFSAWSGAPDIESPRAYIAKMVKPGTVVTTRELSEQEMRDYPYSVEPWAERASLAELGFTVAAEVTAAEVVADLSRPVRNMLAEVARTDGEWPNLSCGTAEAQAAEVIERVGVHPPKWIITDLGRAVAAELGAQS